MLVPSLDEPRCVCAQLHTGGGALDCVCVSGWHHPIVTAWEQKEAQSAVAGQRRRGCSRSSAGVSQERLARRCQRREGSGARALGDEPGARAALAWDLSCSRAERANLRLRL